MAKSVMINGVTYNDVPSFRAPLSGGNGYAVFYETSGADIDASKVLQGYKGYGPNGLVTGTATQPQVSQDSTTKVLTIQ